MMDQDQVPMRRPSAEAGTGAGKPWAQQLATDIGKRIAYYRQERSLSAQQLADRCAELGMPSISRVVITKLENGRRETVSIAEVMMLAAALRVPPVELLFDVRSGEETEFLPGLGAPPWAAALWFIGRYKPVAPGEGLEIPAPGDETDMNVVEAHFQLVADYLMREAVAAQAAREAKKAGAQPDTELGWRAAYWQESLDTTENLLAMVRGEMRRRGFQLPDLPTALRQVDERGASFAAIGVPSLVAMPRMLDIVHYPDEDPPERDDGAAAHPDAESSGTEE